MISRAYLFLVVVIHYQREAESLLGEKVVQARQENFRYVVSVGVKNLHPELRLCQTCTGVAISPKHVLTTSHCIENQVPDNIEILAGSVDIRKITNKDHYNVQRWTKYEDWAKERGIKLAFEENDVVIIEVTRHFDQTKVNLAKFRFLKNEKFYNHRMTLAGWGEAGCSVTKYSKPNSLKQVEVKMIRGDKAERKIRGLSNDPKPYGSNFIFSQAKPFVLTGCGDSGGPVIYHNQVVAMIRGLVPGFVKYNTCQINGSINLLYYKDFIRSFTENNENAPIDSNSNG